MSSYTNKTIQCMCCGFTYKAKILKGFYNSAVADLDTKRMRQIGNVEIPQQAFMSVLKLDEN